MQKANLHEAILLVNRGIDEAVHGLERLKRIKYPRLAADYFGERATLFEEQRARVNAYFCNNVESGEERDAAHFEQCYREYRKRALDEVQVYRDLEAVEERRSSEGKPPKVRLLTCGEQREWERQQPKPPGEGGERV